MSTSRRLQRNVPQWAQKARSSAIRRAVPQAAELPAYSLSEPLVTLFVSPEHRQESMQAFEILKASNTGFTVERSRGPEIAVEFGGKIHDGLQGVRRLADALVSFETTMFPDNLDTGNLRPRDDVRLQAERELREQIAAAQSSLRDILS